MLGLMKKDLLLIKSNKNLILVAFLMVIFLGIIGQMDISFILPFMILMMYISSFSYDEYNNFNAYVCTLPNGRENVVKAKYLLTVLLSIFISVIAVIMTLVISKVSVAEVLSSLTGAVFALVLMVSIFYPLLFKYGSEKGRVILLLGVLAIGGIVTFLFNNENALIERIISFLDSYGLVIIVMASVVAMFVSYFISKKIYLNKEF